MTTHKKNFVVGIEALPGNPYDGHSLVGSLDQAEKLTGIRASDCYVDLGYRGHSEIKAQVHIARTKAALKTYALRRDMKRRDAIELIIWHIKEDGLFSRNHLKGSLSDKINALLCGAVYDLRLILRKLRLFWLKTFWCFYEDFLGNCFVV